MPILHTVGFRLIHPDFVAERWVPAVSAFQEYDFIDS